MYSHSSCIKGGRPSRSRWRRGRNLGAWTPMSLRLSPPTFAARSAPPRLSFPSFVSLLTLSVTGDGWCSKRRQAHFFRVLRLRPPEQCKHKPTKHDALLPHPRRDKHRNARDLPLRGRRVLLVARAVERHRPSHRPRAQAGAPRRRFVPSRRGQFTLSLSNPILPPPHPPP